MSAEVIEMTPHTLQRAGVMAEGNQQEDSTAILLNIEDVIVADRFRKDLGDVSDLKASIVQVGLLNPITVREWHGGYRLVAGERRLTAFKELGLAEIPARVARDIADARDALVAERDENTARKEMLPSEKVALGMAIEEMEKPAAAERKALGQKLGGESAAGRLGVPGNTKQDDTHKSRDAAAEAVDLSPATYTRLKTMVNLASDETQPEEVREAAKSGLEVIDAGGTIRGQYDRLKEIRRKSESVTKEAEYGEKRRTNDPTEYLQTLAKKYPTYRIAFAKEGHERYASPVSLESAAYKAGIKWRFNEKTYAKHCAQSAEWLDRSSMNLEVALDVLSHIDFSTITPEQANEALQRIESVPRQLNLYIRSLKGITNEQ